MALLLDISVRNAHDLVVVPEQRFSNHLAWVLSGKDEPLKQESNE